MKKNTKKPNIFAFEDEYGNKYTLIFYKTKYCTGNTCIACNCTTDNIFFEPYATVTVNLPHAYNYPSRYWVTGDWNNCSKLICEMIDLGIFSYYGSLVRSGYCKYPILEVDNEWLNGLPTKGE